MSTITVAPRALAVRVVGRSIKPDVKLCIVLTFSVPRRQRVYARTNRSPMTLRICFDSNLGTVFARGLLNAVKFMYWYFFVDCNI